MAKNGNTLYNAARGMAKRYRGYIDSLTMRPLSQSTEELGQWFTTPLGAKALAAEQAILEKELNNLFGYHLMQLSIVPEENLAPSSRINHCFSLSPNGAKKRYIGAGGWHQGTRVKALADFHSLPLPDEVVDVTVLHHVLDFAENPQQVLKEAARVTIARGYVLIIGFNPHSFMGMLQPLLRLKTPRGISNRNRLRAARIKDWLTFLDYSTVATRYALHQIPVNNQSFLNHTAIFDMPQAVPMGGIYCILARKDKVALTPIKRSWKAPSILAPVPLPEQSLQAGNAARTKNNKS